ncbi:AGAP007548-PB-like protein [Anopheles sinensis]|uniref:AGAP007548-PB-like protein n=1 Tax=Anopheles sinensis TaxID=74873 RepID=A0A084VCF5_ANOSI|nr:AGAP007548-PB-like protein [Anopheles sinensis]
MCKWAAYRKLAPACNGSSSNDHKFLTLARSIKGRRPPRTRTFLVKFNQHAVVNGMLPAAAIRASAIVIKIYSDRSYHQNHPIAPYDVPEMCTIETVHIFCRSYLHSSQSVYGLFSLPDTHSKYVVRSGFVLPVDPLFVAKVNPFWLQFEPPSAGEHYGLAVFYCVMMLFGVIGNALVVFMFYRYRSLRTPANYLVINLAVADFIIMLEAPMFIYNSIHQGPALGSIGCTVYALMGALGGTVAIGTLTVISIDRYNVVVYPLNPNRSTTKLKCYILIALTWVYGLLFAGLPALDIGLSRYTAEGYMTACSFDYLDLFVYFVFAWVVPFTVISFCYAKILLVVINANSIQSSKSKNKTEVKLAGVVVGIIGLWFVAWTPYAVVAMLGVFGYEEYLTPLNSMIPAVFAKIAACIDPYFYAINHPRYRQMLERMFCNRGVDVANSQYQTSHYTRGGSRAGDSVGEDSIGTNQAAAAPSGPRTTSIRVAGGRSSRLVNARGSYSSAAPGGVKALKKQASNGDETSLEVSLEM